MDVPNQDIRGVSFDIFVYFFNSILMCVSYKQTLYSLRSCIKTNLLLLLLLLVRVCAHQGKQGPWEHLRMCPTILKIFPPTLKVEFISMDPLYHVTGFYANSTKSLYIFQNIFSTQNPTWIGNPGEYESSIWPKYADIFSFNVHSSPCIDSNHMPFPRWFEPCTTLLLKLETKLDKFEGLFTLLDNLKSIKYICNLKSTQLSH